MSLGINTLSEYGSVGKHEDYLDSQRHRYDALLAAQGGHCALCPATPKKRRFDLDHDHKRMEIRGLLCHRCNRALPSWVTKEWLLAAIDYIDSTATA